VFNETVRLAPAIGEVRPEQRLPLIEMAMPGLRQMSVEQLRTFAKNLKALADADEEIDLFEFAVLQIVVGYVRTKMNPAGQGRVKYYSLGALAGECEALLSALAHHGHDDPESAAKAFDEGVALLKIRNRQFKLHPAEESGLAAIDKALKELRVSGALHKKLAVEACAACVASDGKATIEEAELLRAVSGALGCPMPPLLPGQTLV